MLERLGFTQRRALHPVKDLSGGQRRRLQLLLILLDEPNVLILDEPTNDLDTDMLAAIEDLLDSWPGALLVVSTIGTSSSGSPTSSTRCSTGACVTSPAASTIPCPPRGPGAAALIARARRRRRIDDEHSETGGLSFGMRRRRSRPRTEDPEGQAEDRRHARTPRHPRPERLRRTWRAQREGSWIRVRPRRPRDPVAGTLRTSRIAGVGGAAASAAMPAEVELDLADGGHKKGRPPRFPVRVGFQRITGSARRPTAR